MSPHEVKITLPDKIDVQRADVGFDIHRNGEKLGTLKISRGDIEWVPVNHKYGVKVDWAEFAELMESQEEPVT